jgi:hypothetical protein
MLLPAPACSFTNAEVEQGQSIVKRRNIGDRIVFWAEKFVGTPYDKDIQGEYVSKKVIVADERVDCMYFTFRSVELAMSNSPEGAIEAALDKRFRTHGILACGLVANYEDRFEYGEDMIDSGKWGAEVTSLVGKTTNIEGSRGKSEVAILSAKELRSSVSQLKSGDLLFFIKRPVKRVRDEIVGHIGIVKVENTFKEVYLIHAGGTKTKGGAVKKVLLDDYIKTMPYIGARITRFL